MPSMCTGMRGRDRRARSTLRGPERDLHSGSFGGAVPNPLHALAALLAGLHDDGRPGHAARLLRQGGRAHATHERELIARLPFDEKAGWPTPGSSRRAAGEAGFSTLERIWARPTAEVNGMWGGYTGPGGKTIVPREAHAKLSFRLVADQEPAEVAAAAAGVRRASTPRRASTRDRHRRRARACGRAFSPLDSPAVAAGRGRWSARSARRCCSPGRAAAARRPTWPTSSARRWCSSAVGLDEDRIHAPNEKVDMALLLKGAEAAAYLWDELAALAGTEGTAADGG